MGFLVIAGLVLWRGFLASGRRVASFPNGRQLIIRQSTYGTEHQFITGNALAKVVAPALPDSLKGKIGVRTFTEKTERPTVVVWGEWRLGKDTSPTAASVSQMLRIKRQGSQDARNVVVWWGRHYGAYLALPLNNFPRRDPILHLEICEFDKGWRLKPVAEFSLPNPSPKNFPQWKADPYPIVKRTGGLEFSMANFSAGQFVADPWLTVMRHLQLGTGYTAIFRVAENSRALDNWEVKQLIVRDATGNIVKSRLQPSVQVGDYLVFGLGEVLWPSEQAWKFETEFTRTSGFTSNEVCSMEGISIPAFLGTATQVLASAKANGAELIGVELQRMRPVPSLQRMREDLEIEPLLPRTLTNRIVSLAAVKDDQGRALNHDRSYFNLDGMHFGIELLPDSRALDLTFAVQEPVVIQFVGGLSESLPKSGR